MNSVGKLKRVLIFILKGLRFKPSYDLMIERDLSKLKIFY